MNTLLVVGSAPCLFEDVARALALRPFSSIMLVNGACTAIERAEHVLAGHEEKAEMFARERRKRFPNAPPWKLHACCMPRRTGQYQKMFPSVTDWHPHEVGVGATSASKAAKLGFLLGFNEVVLCGCPMDQPGYFEGEAKVAQHQGCMRIGDHGLVKNFGGRSEVLGPDLKPQRVQDTRIIQGYREKLKELAAGPFKNRVFSMSGFTRAQLGAPPEVE